MHVKCDYALRSKRFQSSVTYTLADLFLRWHDIVGFRESRRVKHGGNVHAEFVHVTIAIVLCCVLILSSIGAKRFFLLY